MNYFLLLSCCFLFAHPSFSSKRTLEKEINAIVDGKQATIGVAVIENGRTLFALNNEKHYVLQSVFKFHLALAVLDHLEKQGSSLETEIFVEKSDLRPDTYSPLAQERPEGNFKMTVADLLRYSVSQSDNNACDILFKFIGGPQAAEDYIKKQGIKEISIKDTETSLHEDRNRQYRNWTTPVAAARLVETFTQKKLFKNSQHQDFLEKIMIETSTGTDKIKGLLPAEVIVGHKTGSAFREANGVKGADNDLAFIRIPDGREYTIAIFVMDSKEDDKTNASIIARISKAVYEEILHR